MAQSQQNSGILEIDIHGMTKYQAKVCLDSLLKKVKKDVYRIRIIHGFHSGTELKDMILYEFRGNEKIIRIENGINPGITELVLREF